MSDKGRIDLHVEDDSVFLSNNLPYVVRDARQSVVAKGTTQEGVSEPLPEGLYSVEVMTPRGRVETQLVQVGADEPTRLVVTEDGLSVGGTPTPAAPGGDTPAEVDAADRPAAPPAAAAATFVGTRHCVLESTDDEGWIFLPDSPLAAVPVAIFELSDTQWEISLPLNPQGEEARVRRCRVRVDQTQVVPRLEVSVGDRRRVFRLLIGMLCDNRVAGGAELLDAAAGLLLTKYSDPVAAALGGLTLHRFSRLEERQSWVENLSREFPWLPDGRILCAALLQRDPDANEKARGLDLLISATEGRPMYTDGLSLGLELLRRWPGSERTAERTDRLEHLAQYSATADWESIALTTANEG